MSIELAREIALALVALFEVKAPTPAPAPIIIG
jgi:hypothetical protein